MDFSDISCRALAIYKNTYGSDILDNVQLQLIQDNYEAGKLYITIIKKNDTDIGVIMYAVSTDTVFDAGSKYIRIYSLYLNPEREHASRCDFLMALRALRRVAESCYSLPVDCRVLMSFRYGHKRIGRPIDVICEV